MTATLRAIVLTLCIAVSACLGSILYVSGIGQGVAHDRGGAIRGKRIDLLHIDGDHAYAVVKNDLESFAPLVRPGGMIAMHDVAGKPGCIQLWKEFSAAHADWRPRLIRPGVGPGIGIMRRPNA